MCLGSLLCWRFSKRTWKLQNHNGSCGSKPLKWSSRECILRFLPRFIFFFPFPVSLFFYFLPYSPHLPYFPLSPSLLISFSVFYSLFYLCPLLPFSSILCFAALQLSIMLFFIQFLNKISVKKIVLSIECWQNL